MNNTIWKFPVQLSDRFRLDMPRGARPISAAMQPGQGPMIWAEVDSDAPTETRVFRVVGTGHPLPIAQNGIKFNFLGTVQQPPFVWHVYEEDSTGATSEGGE